MANSVLALASALARTFLVIGLGSAAALSGYLDRNAALGVGQLVAKVCLPALLFQATASRSPRTSRARCCGTAGWRAARRGSCSSCAT